MPKQDWEYLTVWEFQVKPGQEGQFEKTYGSDGAWAQLFRRAEGYLGSELVRDLDRARRYLTLDFWTSRSAYERFSQENGSEYRALDEQCEQMTESEVQIGGYERAR